MVYVAFGIVILSLCSICYVYKETLWATIWSTNRKRQSLPDIRVGAAGTRPTDDVSPNEARSKQLKIADAHVLNTEAPTTKGDQLKDNGTTTEPSQGERQNPPQDDDEPKSHTFNGTASNSVEVMNASKPSPASGMANGSSNISMPPPARPGPRIRSKASKPMPTPSIPKSQNFTTLGVPQTASSLRPLPSGGSSSLQPPPSQASTLRIPPSRPLTTPSSSLAPTSSTLPSSARPSKKVLLSPGHSPLDWAYLTTHPPSPTFLRGADVPSTLIRVPPSLLKYHNGRKGKNAWAVWQGKVYNLTPYMDFHPGGVDQLMKGAGREKDGERLFLEVHPWVNWENMLGECMIGILVGEEEEQKDGGGLDDMD
ncbi:MAG: hypothetical protein Q9209_001454 [Squamulea sp. 1 TL-2023]